MNALAQGISGYFLFRIGLAPPEQDVDPEETEYRDQKRDHKLPGQVQSEELFRVIWVRVRHVGDETRVKALVALPTGFHQLAGVQDRRGIARRQDVVGAVAVRAAGYPIVVSKLPHFSVICLAIGLHRHVENTISACHPSLSMARDTELGVVNTLLCNASVRRIKKRCAVNTVTVAAHGCIGIACQCLCHMSFVQVFILVAISVWHCRHEIFASRA